MPHDTHKRHKRLYSLLKRKTFDSQEGLLEKLKSDGFDVTQTTLSRDLQKIGAQKMDGVYTITEMDYLFGDMGKIKSMKFIRPNLIVIKTVMGLAQATGLMIDRSIIPGLMGTVTGHDTIFAAVETDKYEEVLEALQDLFLNP